MITYKRSFKGNNLDSITIEGHALFADYGKDIVCAAVSTATIVSINAIESLNEEENIKVTIEEGYVKIEVIKNTPTVVGLLNNLIYSLKDIEIQFPNHLKEE
ncbi:MAG: ribosomal-processing cysteine protease Prp [Acholeplasmataceae bacterium]|nr:ribosomal-processing cysteine protease Prp [Acholeplasmataceae bacterium]